MHVLFPGTMGHAVVFWPNRKASDLYGWSEMSD